MLWKKRITKIASIIMAGALFAAAGTVYGDSMPITGTKTEETEAMRMTSSVRRSVPILIEESEEEFYLASVDEGVLPARRQDSAVTVSGNDASSDTLKTQTGEVLDLVNQAREEIGLSALVWDEELAEAAAVRAEEIALVFSHRRPDGSEWWTVNENIVYGENLAKGYNDSESVMEAWMASPEHKDNILYTNFISVGVASYEKDGSLYWVQIFGY